MGDVILLGIGGGRRTGGGKDALLPGAGRLRLGCGIVGQLHHVVEVVPCLTSPNVEDVHLALMQSGNRLEIANAVKLASIGTLVLEVLSVNDFDGPEVPEDRLREPDFSIAPAADAS